MVRRLGQADRAARRVQRVLQGGRAQSIAVTDSAVRQRVRRHVELLARVVTLAESSPTSGVALIPTAPSAR